MTDPYLFERGIGQQMGDLCRLAVGDAKVTQTGEIVTLEDMPRRGNMGVSVEVPYTAGGVQSVSVTRCGKNLLDKDNKTIRVNFAISAASGAIISSTQNSTIFDFLSARPVAGKTLTLNHRPSGKYPGIAFYSSPNDNAYTDGIRNANATPDLAWTFLVAPTANYFRFCFYSASADVIQLEIGDTATDYEPYNGDTYTITLPADFYGGTVNLEAGTVTSRYAADGSLLAEPVITEIDHISIPILAGVNNVWADVGTVTVSYYAADAEIFRPALWYPTIYRGLTSARYLIKRASGAIASFGDAIAAPLVGLRVALPYDAEGYQSVSVTVNGTLTTITLPTTIYGGYLDVVTGQLVATHDENGNLLTNQKLYFLPPTNINALAGVNNVRSDAGDVAVSYRIDNG